MRPRREFVVIADANRRVRCPKRQKREKKYDWNARVTCNPAIVGIYFALAPVCCREPEI